MSIDAFRSLRIPQLYSPQTAGVIFQTEREAFRVLDQNGTVRAMQPHQISSAKTEQEARRAVGLDRNDKEFRVGDLMTEVDGEVSSDQSSITSSAEVEVLCPSIRADEEMSFKSIEESSLSFSTAKANKILESLSFVARISNLLATRPIVRKDRI